MSETLKELRGLSEEELITRHDNHAKNTGVGVKHYLAELARRDQDNQTGTMLSFTKWITIMTLAILIFTAINVVVAVLFITK